MPENRVFSPGFKLAAVQRLVDGEKVKALAEELEVSRQLLYKWWSQYERGGVLRHNLIRLAWRSFLFV